MDVKSLDTDVSPFAFSFDLPEVFPANVCILFSMFAIDPIVLTGHPVPLFSNIAQLD